MEAAQHFARSVKDKVAGDERFILYDGNTVRLVFLFCSITSIRADCYVSFCLKVERYYKYSIKC